MEKGSKILISLWFVSLWVAIYLLAYTIGQLEEKVELQRGCIETLEDNITNLRDTLDIEY